MDQYDSLHSCSCLEELSQRDRQQVLLKGLKTLIKRSEEQEMTKLAAYLKQFKQSDENLHVHKDCRRKFTDSRRQSTNPVPAKKLRSSVTVTFDSKSLCFFHSSKVDFRNKDRDQHRRIMTINIKNNILLAAEKRNDEWGKEVYGRISACNDLVAEEAVYHLTCLGIFNKKNWF